MPFYISGLKYRKNITLNVEVVTPMFLGGADQKMAELRAASLKGLLRFWWRATCGIDDLARMKSIESEIFGSTSRMASFSIMLESVDVMSVRKNLPQGKKFKIRSRRGVFKLGIIDYLAFGIRDHRSRYTREHIPSGRKFLVRLKIGNPEYEEEILKAFRALVSYGGIGSKSRNGFGSVHVANLQPFPAKYKGSIKKFSAFSERTVLFNDFQEHDSWEGALSEIGLIYRQARLSLEGKHKYDRRLLIGKPIVQAGNPGERHAKPYFLKIKKLPNGKYRGQILFMPYHYYDQRKSSEYWDVCNRMNVKIRELMRG